MRNKFMAVILVFAITLTPTFAAPSIETSPARARASVPTVYNDHVRVVSKDGRTAVDTLVGKAALARLAELRARKPATFAKADALMEAKGYKRTETVVVRQSGNLRKESASGVQPAQELYSSNSETVFYSWDDGNNGTWEGMMYVADYSTGEEILVSGQCDITRPSIEIPVLWEQTVSYSGGTTIAPEARNERSRPAVQVATMDSDGVEHARSVAGANDIQRVQFRAYLKRFLLCSVGGCIGVAAYCAAAGPGFWHCMALGCGAVVVGCSITSL